MCSNFFEAVIKGEHHYCQIPSSSDDCRTRQGVSALTFGDVVVTLDVALHVDLCNGVDYIVELIIDEKYVKLTLNGKFIVCFYIVICWMNAEHVIFDKILIIVKK